MKRLVIRTGALGDCILAFPAMEQLASRSATEIWAPSAVVPLIRFGSAVAALSSTGIDMVGIDGIATPEHFTARIRQFDSVVSWYGAQRSEFREAIAATGVRCEFHAALPPADGHEHAIDFFARQVGAPAGLTPRIPIASQCRRGSLVIHPFSGGARKNWPYEHYREVAARVALPAEWTAGPEEELPQAHRFESTGDLAVWLAGASAYIGNDSGVTHLAAALGVRVIAVFMTTPWEVWAPRGPNVSVLVRPSVDDVLALIGRA